MGSWDMLDKVQWEYMEKFHVDRPPGMIMMQSAEDYIEMLEKAIARGTPVEDGDYPECDIVD